MYEDIKKDQEIIDIYNQINDIENKENAWAYHNYTHALNVAGIIDNILTELNYPKDLIEEAKIAAILHDVGNTKGKKDHEKRSYEFAKDYLKRKNKKLKYYDEVLEAIKIHRDGFDSENIIASALIFADKIDITKERVTEYGKQIEGMRQLLYINDIKINISDDCLNVYFDVDSKIDFKELKSFYFMQKVLKSIDSFARKINLESNVYFHNGYKKGNNNRE